MKNVYRKLLAFQKNSPKITKNCTANIGNRQYKYADLNSILEAINPALNSLGLVISQAIDGENLKTTIADVESGESIESNFPLIFVGMTFHQIGSSISYARRYAIVSLVGLTADDDDDAVSTVSAKIPDSYVKRKEESCNVCGEELRLSKNGKPYCHSCWQLKRNQFSTNGIH